MIVKGIAKQFRPLLHQPQIRPEIVAAGAVYGTAVTALGQRPAKDFVNSIPLLVANAKGGPWSTFGAYLDLGTPRPGTGADQPAAPAGAPGTGAAQPAGGQRQIVAPDQAAATTKAAGRMGDSELVHINREELEELRGQWGEPTINPQTGLPEFFLGGLKKKLKKFWKKVEKSKFGSPLHGLKAGYSIHKMLSPTYHIKDRVRRLQRGEKLFSREHIEGTYKANHHYIQDAFKENWPVLAVFAASWAGGAMAGGGGSAASGAAGTGGAAGAGAGGAAAGAGGAGAAAGLETVTVTASSGGSGAAGFLGAAGAAGAAAPTAAAPSAPSSTPATQPSKGFLSKTMDGWSNLSFSEKLLISKMGVDMVSGLLAPKEEDLLEKSKTWQGAFYGKTADEAAKAPAVAPAAAPTAAPAMAASGPRSIVPESKAATAQSAAPAAQRTILPPQLNSTATPPAPRRLAELNPAEEGDSLFQSRAPGVRYIV